MEYLYGEMSPSERHAFKQELEGRSDLNGELLGFIQLREIIQEHLPEKKAPSRLTKKLLAELGIRRPWYQALTEGWLRPALAGAMVLALTLGVAYQVRQWRAQPERIAKNEPFVASSFHDSEKELKFSDLFLANRPMIPHLRAPVRRTAPGFGYGSGGLVSLASYGPASRLQATPELPDAGIRNLDREADQAVAQFVHQQALRMRAMGDFQGAADHLATLIKVYPSYPLKLEALAQRIDCLFKSGDKELAQKELAWLRTFSPDLAYLVERRWQ
jgi:hypothetical protein